MNNRQVEHWLLLEESGELNAWQRWRLHRALARQPELAQFRTDLHQLVSLSRAAVPGREMSPEILGAIRQAAAEQQQSGEAHAGETAWLKHAVAMTAMLVIVGGLTLINQYRPTAPRTALAAATDPQGAWGDDIDRELDHMSNLLAANFETGAETVLDENSVARELLQLEGIER